MSCWNTHWDAPLSTIQVNEIRHGIQALISKSECRGGRLLIWGKHLALVDIQLSCRQRRIGWLAGRHSQRLSQAQSELRTPVHGNSSTPPKTFLWNSSIPKAKGWAQLGTTKDDKAETHLNSARVWNTHRAEYGRTFSNKICNQPLPEGSPIDWIKSSLDNQHYCHGSRFE